MTSIRTAVIYPSPVPYHDRVFEFVAADAAIDLTVFFGRRRLVGRDWELTELRYPHRFLLIYGLAVQRRDVLALDFNLRS